MPSSRPAAESAFACATMQSLSASTRRPRPSRRWHTSPRTRMSLALLVTLLASSNHLALARQQVPSLSPTSTSVSATTMPVRDDMLQPRLPPQRRGEEVGLQRRDGGGPDRALTSMTTAVGRPSATLDANPSPLPSPFDDARPSIFRGSNSDDKCPSFMTALLADPTFKSCYPLSLLLRTSSGFFEAQKHLPSIVRVLDTACKANAAFCTAFLNQAADNLAAAANCKAELDQGQSYVLQAWRGLKAYRTMYAASCLQDSSSSLYCFANSVSNLDDPSDAYLYFMPYGLALPSASTPSCNKCTSETMKIYHAASANRSDAISDKYEAAAHHINSICGPEFVNSTLPEAEAAASLVPPPSSLALLTAVLAVVALSPLL